jgi:hypothetical protein
VCLLKFLKARPELSPSELFSFEACIAKPVADVFDLIDAVRFSEGAAGGVVADEGAGGVRRVCQRRQKPFSANVRLWAGLPC